MLFFFYIGFMGKVKWAGSEWRQFLRYQPFILHRETGQLPRNTPAETATCTTSKPHRSDPKRPLWTAQGGEHAGTYEPTWAMSCAHKTHG